MICLISIGIAAGWLEFSPLFILFCCEFLVSLMSVELTSQSVPIIFCLLNIYLADYY